MATPAEEGTKLAWRWVIEALAETKEVETSILIDLAKRDPDVLKDTNVNERVALRCLDEFVGSDNGKSDDNAFSLMGVNKTSRDQFPVVGKDDWKLDVESRSVDVLYAYMKKKKRHPDHFYNHGVRHFVSQKLAALPKSYLAVMDESIDRNHTISGNAGLNNESPLYVHNDKKDSPEYVNEHMKLTSCSRKNPPSPIPDHVDIPSKKASSRVERHFPKANNLTEKILNDLVCGDGETTLSYDPKGKKVQREPPNEARRSEEPVSCNILHSEHKDSEKSAGDQSDSDQFPVCDSLDADGPQLKLCIMCNKSGQLLECRDTCEVAVHESCLGFPVSSEDLDEFYCPFCAHMRAISSYNDARRKVSNCKKALSSFVSRIVNYKTKPGQQGVIEESSSSESDVGEGYRIEERVKTSKKEQQQTTKHVEVSRINVHVKGNEHILFPEADIFPPIVGNQDATSIQQEVCLNKHQCESDNAFVNNSKFLTSNGVVKYNDKDNKIKNDLCNRASDVHQHREADEKSKNDVFHCQESNKSSKKDLHVSPNLENLEESDEQVPESGNHRVSSEVATFSKRKYSKNIKEEVESSDLDNGSHRKPLKRRKRYANPVIPSGRRNRLPWTTEEEDILKESFQKFYGGGEGNISWTRILEYGRHIFHKTRQPNDLKDKWRNIRNKEEKA